MAQAKQRDNLTALPLVAPFLLVYAALFVWPALQMVWMSFTDGQLILPGKFVGLDNYLKLFRDFRMGNSLRNTGFFVLLTVLPSTLLGLGIAMMINRLRGIWQSVVLAVFFLPYILPVTTVLAIWTGVTAVGRGPLGPVVQWITGEPVQLYQFPWLVLPFAALITVWWTVGFNALLFLAGLRNISPDLYEAARLDGASRWVQFRNVTWPLIWPVTVLVLTIQLIVQIKVFDQVYLLAGSRVDPSMVLVQYVYTLAFERNQGGYAATVAVAVFVIVAALAVLQFQFTRLRAAR